MRAWIVAAALTCVTVMGQTQAKKPSAAPKPGRQASLPTNEAVDAALTRTLGYDQAATWKVVYIGPSEVPGISNVVVLMNNQNYASYYVLSGVQKAIKGEMVPFGPNPFAEYRRKLVAADGPARGPVKPVISMVEFSDLECPHCKAAQPTVEKLAADFPQVRYVFQNFPLPTHPWAMKAAQYADCAAQQSKDAFWKYIDSIFENQGAIAEATADDKLKELAIGAGLEAQRLSLCAAQPATAVRVEKSVALGKSVGVQGTPTVFINGRPLPGLGGLDYDHLKALVQFEIAHAGK